MGGGGDNGNMIFLAEGFLAISGGNGGCDIGVLPKRTRIKWGRIYSTVL